MELLVLIFKLIFALATVLGLMYLTFKLSGDRLNKMNNGKYIKVLESTQISKESSITVVKVGTKGYVLGICNSNIEKLEELSDKDILMIEENKLKEKEKLNQQYYKAVSEFKSKINRFKRKNNLKEDFHEEE
ncbi:flagellar biosynthetic protein FliO [Clostridium sp. AL.422]|uniref:flagellar biosynthetic protein FliO n=1 Tax=Clostridium TaxID=1485 RepID=UPI00293DDE52|nr:MULTISPECIES: flagellar biosynthetic protein FliO [unclassified Clostridium]MDV4149693.1 flagellar biosynthetic protein FliO [Clostridium sp. AL.422]